MFGENIRKLRKDSGLTQKQLADRAGFSPSILSEYENDQVEIPAGRLVAIARALNATLYDLTGYAGPVDPAEVQRRLRSADLEQLITALREKMEEHPDQASVERGLKFIRLLGVGPDLKDWQVEAIRTIMAGGGNKKEEV